jgi:hypothetical protein
VAGTVMIALPMALSRTAMNLPPALREDTMGYVELVDTAAAVDRAFALGDLRRLQAVVTPRYLERLSAALRRSAGQALDRKSMLEQGVHVGDLQKLRFILGRSSRDRVALAYDMASPERDGGYPVRRAVFVLQFVWDGSAFRLDGKTTRDLRAGQSAARLAELVVDELLRG